ncbi:hypothetical protein H2201_008084 [Coniosporium apollinis]|uniref:ATPase n=2 Tax=Coniosporium TaxID=2810619 RepID=A0ABQ9NHU7_9PEZI|nr:hypothetical protein H2201_008084 [Coniosporium apollinis]
MHRTYSMRQSRAPTASQLANPPPPASTTKAGRFFGKANIGHNFRRSAAGAFGPDLAKKLSQLVKMEKNVMRSMELVSRERMEVAQQLSIWGEACDDDVSDVTDKLGVLIYEIGELEDQYVDRYDQYRVTIKSIRNIEASVQPSRDRKQKITDQIAQLKYKEPNSPRIVVLEQELVRAEAESLVAEAQLSNITREKLKAAFNYQFDAMREHCEKVAIIAGYGKHLLELIDDTPVTPGETRNAYDGYEASKAIIQDCEDALTNWVEQNASVKASLSTRARQLSQRRKAGRHQGEGVDLSHQDAPMENRESGLWIPASQHAGNGYEDEQDEEEDERSTQVTEQRGREEERATARFDFSQAAACSYLVLIVIFGFVEAQLRVTGAYMGLVTGESCLAITAFAACLALPRRPDVYYEGKIVDRQWGLPAFHRYAYSWAAPLLKASAAGKALAISDLPKMDHYTRSKELHELFEDEDREAKTKSKDSTHDGKLGTSLIKLIILSHWPAFSRQYILTVLQSLFLVAPQLAMFKLLKLLEARQNGAYVTPEASMWTVAMGLAIIIQTFFENWMWWVSYSQCQVPVRIQLSALIFTKSMRRKDVKGVQNSKEDTNNVKVAKDVAQPDAASDESEDEEDGIEEDVSKTRQGTVNLVGVDTKRVSDFATYNNLLLGALCNMAASFTFLGILLGWQALLAGIGIQLLTMPLNIWASKWYTSAQERLMSVRDRKLAVLNEALAGIRQIKFSALERQWSKRIMDRREDELKAQWESFVADIWLMLCYIIGPVMLSAVCLGVYAVIHGGLSASVAFTAIAILSQIEGTLGFVPELVANGLDAWVSVKRVQDYLNAPEKPQSTEPGDSVSFKDATVSWPSDEEQSADAFVLRNLNLSFPNGHLSVISGRTGSGKSLLLAAILGEADILGGTITVPQAPPLHDRHDHKANKSNWVIPSAIAFVSQQPWIENCTFKDNILFGLPFDKERYDKVISACAMEKDLEMLTDGDSTEIGANGINLSGGQRWRITLARALYSRAGILIMDDIFSAVDAHVGKHIFEQALTGELAQGRTRILVTHHVSLCLPKTKYEVLLGDGRVERAGLVEDLRKTGELQDILEEENEAAVSDDGEPALLPSPGLARRQSSGLARIDSRASGRPRAMSHSDNLARVTSHASKRSGSFSAGPAVMDPKLAAKKFVEEETKEKGHVAWKVYYEYLQASGGAWFWIGVLVAFGGYQGLLLGRSWWITLWTRTYDTKSAHTNQPATLLYQLSSTQHASKVAQNRDPTLTYYLSIYVALSVIIVIGGTLRYLWMFYGSILASRRLFEKLSYAVLRAPLRWLDTVPLGRILNRFTADFNIIDSDLIRAASFGLYNVMTVVGIVVAGAFVSPFILVFAVILLAINVRYAIYYLAGAREAKRLESIAKSPIFEYFGAALAGVSTIRAFGKSDAYISSMFAKLDAHAQALWHQWLFNRWLTVRLAAIGAAFSVATAAFVVSLDKIGASVAGFALSFTLQYSESVVWMLRQYANTELGMNATERILEYTNITTEPEGGADAPAAWPTEGRLAVSNLVVGYAPDLPPVLKGLTFDVEPNERVGVAGRTGAGKSSLTLALFRFLEAREGSIYIDGVDISKIKLYDLRSRLAIIPQDPVLFSGTVRSNLDPFNEHSDVELREALARVHLIASESSEGSSTHEPEPSGSSTPTHTNTNPFSTLSTPISEGGQNLSQGQRQLLCLARAIVSRPKIIILDEATSAVDKATDELIQRSIREQFTDSTLLVIAHRLSTIADFDRILVMGEGRVVEYDTPKKLFEAGGTFRGMVEDSGEKDVLREVILGEKGR